MLDSILRCFGLQKIPKSKNSGFVISQWKDGKVCKACGACKQPNYHARVWWLGSNATCPSCGGECENVVMTWVFASGGHRNQGRYVFHDYYTPQDDAKIAKYMTARLEYFQ